MIIDSNTLMPLSYLLADNKLFKRWASNVFKIYNKVPECLIDDLAEMSIKSEIVCAISEEREKLYTRNRMKIVAFEKNIKNIKKDEWLDNTTKKQRIEDLKGEIRDIQIEIEQSATQGLDYFEEVFEGCFSENHIILRSVFLMNKTDKGFHRTFINYRFNMVQQAKDFSVLFFAHWLFDLYCKENPCMLSSDKKVMAQKIADVAYKILTCKDYSRYSIERLLFSFFTKYLNEDSMYLYFSCLVQYVQAVYHSKALAEEERYEIFKLWGWSILLINNLLSVSNRNCSPIFDEQPLEVEKNTVIKKMYNYRYQWGNKKESNKEIVQLSVELTSEVSKLLKEYPKIPSYSNRICKSKCREILLKIDEILDLCEEELDEKYFFKILRSYNNIYLVNEQGEKINFWIFVLQSAYFQIKKDALPRYDGNIYLDMLTTFSSSRRKKRLYKRIRTLIKSTMEEIPYQIVLNENQHDVEKGKTNRIGLDFLKLPLLTFDTQKAENTKILKQMIFIYGC